MPKFVCLLFLLLSGTLVLNAQTGRDSVPLSGDSSLSPFVKKVLAAGAHERKKSEATYKAGSTSIRQRAVWEALSRTAREVKLYLGTGISIKTLTSELKTAEATFSIVRDGIFVNQGTAQTERNLAVSSVILYQLIIELEARKIQIDKFAQNLILYRNRIDSLLSDSIIYVFPKDSVALVKYLQRLRVIVNEGNPSDNALNEALVSVQDLQNSTDGLLFTFKVAREEIEAYRFKLAGVHFKREFSNIWEKAGYKRPFKEILYFSLAKEKVALVFYARQHILEIVLLVFLTTLAYFSIRSVKQRIAGQQDNDTADYSKYLINRYPLASAFIITLSIYQFAFINAPFVFYICLWMCQVICLAVLLKSFITPFWFRFWIVLSALFLLACCDNLILQASRPERWIMALLSAFGVAYGGFIILSAHRKELKEPLIILFLKFFWVMELCSLLFNVFGRYNLSKSLFIAGYTGVITAILFIWVVRLINELLRAGSSLYKYQDRKLFYINFNRIGSRAPASLYILLVVGWIILTGRNFYLFKKLAAALQDSLHKERTLGDYSFSINNVFLFILIAFCALALSRIVSFFAADSHAVHNSGQNSKKLAPGSWILLLRICIISIGLFLAFAASGIPLDKITIVLGALSVGIGLGLQGLVSNLVSGLIVAFERPVNVGDMIEINGKTGTMKSIGFRSSIVLLGDGSSLVVPNGDLLNNHLVNWSLNRNHRRIIVPVSVAYGTDLSLVRDILEGIAAGDDRITQSPAPFAAAKSFGDYAISFDFVFWIKNYRNATLITGDVITAIDKAFREQHIIIPVPQQELYLHQPKPEDENQQKKE